MFNSLSPWNSGTNQQADHWRVPRPVNKVPRVLITSLRPWWANDQDVTRLQAKAVPNNLIWSKSALLLLSSSVHNIPGAIITAMGMPIMPPWANGHDVAHLYAKTVAKNLIWSESAQRPEALSTDSRSPYCAHGMPIWPQWANDHDIAHLEAETVPTNLIWSESAEWLLSYGPDEQTDRCHSIVPLFFFWNGGTKSGIFKLIF